MLCREQSGRLFFTFFLISFFFPAFANAAPMREIRVTAAVSPAYQSLPSWKSDFERRLIYASKIFEGEFKIKLKLIRYTKWNPSDETIEMTSLLEQLRGDVPIGDSDIVIGLTHLKMTPDQPNQRDLHTLGQARPFTGHLVIRYPANKLFKVQEDTVLVHELGHVFGAIHTDDPRSIMSPVVDKQLPSRFDATNRQIILETRSLNLNRGAESLPVDVLQGLLRSYLKMIEKNGSADFYYSLGMFYLQLNQPQDAIKAWKHALGLAPENSEMHYNLGALYIKSGDYTKAISELSHAVSGLQFNIQKPMKASALTLLGEAYFQQDNMFAAFNAWTRAAALNPGDLDLQVNLAVVKFRQGQLSDAVNSFQRILGTDPQNIKALTYLGKALAQEEKYAEALQYWELALAQLNRQPRTSSQISRLSALYGDIGNVHLKENKQKEAFESFQAACDLAPSAECHKRMGLTLFNSRQWDGAAREFAKVIETEKTDPDLYGMLGTALAQKGDIVNAVSVFKEGLRYAESAPMQSRLHRNLGNLFINAKQYTMAETEFRLALAKNWGDAESHFGLAAALLGLNQPTGAIDSLKSVQRIDPKNERAKSMIQSIETSLKNSTSNG